MQVAQFQRFWFGDAGGEWFDEKPRLFQQLTAVGRLTGENNREGRQHGTVTVHRSVSFGSVRLSGREILIRATLTKATRADEVRPVRGTGRYGAVSYRHRPGLGKRRIDSDVGPLVCVWR